MKIKVCGLRDNIGEVVALKPDFIGLIFYPKSKRYVGNMPSSMLDGMPSQIKRVGVFVDQPMEEVIGKVNKYGLDLVQLHGHEPVEYCQKFKQLSDAGVIKVFSGNNLPDEATLAAYGTTIDYYLFDTRNESYGGTGQKFDWTVLKDLKLTKPIFLSGGIGLDNLESVENGGLPVYALDVNSKFEVKPGLKDIERLNALFYHARRTAM